MIEPDLEGMKALEALKAQLLGEIKKEREEFIGDDPAKALYFKLLDQEWEKWKPALMDLLVYGEARIP